MVCQLSKFVSSLKLVLFDFDERLNSLTSLEQPAAEP
jgi:hypothetical protein